MLESLHCFDFVQQVSPVPSNSQNAMQPCSHRFHVDQLALGPSWRLFEGYFEFVTHTIYIIVVVTK